MGDLATLMSAHFCAAMPNFRIMEYEVDDVPWRGEFVTHPPVVENGQLVVPTRPGWGADMNEEAVRAPAAQEGAAGEGAIVRLRGSRALSPCAYQVTAGTSRLEDACNGRHRSLLTADLRTEGNV